MTTRIPDGLIRLHRLHCPLDTISTLKLGQSLVNRVTMQTCLGIENKTKASNAADTATVANTTATGQVVEQVSHIFAEDASIQRVGFIVSVGQYWTYVEYGRELMGNNLVEGDLDTQCYRSLRVKFRSGGKLRTIPLNSKESMMEWLPKVRERLIELTPALRDGLVLTETQFSALLMGISPPEATRADDAEQEWKRMWKAMRGRGKQSDEDEDYEEGEEVDVFAA